MINSACRGSPSVQYSDVFCIYKCCTWSNGGKKFDNEVFGQLLSELVLLLSRAQHHKVVTVSEHRYSGFGRVFRQGDKTPVKAPIAVMASSHATAMHCAAFFVPYMALSTTAFLQCLKTKASWLHVEAAAAHQRHITRAATSVHWVQQLPRRRLGRKPPPLMKDFTQPRKHQRIEKFSACLHHYDTCTEVSHHNPLHAVAAL